MTEHTDRKETEPKPSQELQAREKTVQLTDAQLAERRKKNAVLGWSLAGFALLVFLVSMLKLSGNA